LEFEFSPLLTIGWPIRGTHQLSTSHSWHQYKIGKIMKFKTSLLSATALVLALGTNLVLATAQARDNDHNQYNNGYNNGYNNSNGHGNNGNHYGNRKKYRQVQRQNRNAYRARVYDWKTERGMYNSNWNKISDANRRALDTQMRSQWMSYNNNNYSGATTWNNYNDPKFMDYLHTRNPGLLTNLRTNLGF
jgi:hypothetical protein